MNNQYVKIEKLTQISDTETLPIGYWIKGILADEIEVGKRLCVYRYIRNNEKIPGIMTTSIIKEIFPWSTLGEKEEPIVGVDIHTENSTYRIEFLDEKDFEKDVETSIKMQQ